MYKGRPATWPSSSQQVNPYIPIVIVDLFDMWIRIYPNKEYVELSVIQSRNILRLKIHRRDQNSNADNIWIPFSVFKFCNTEFRLREVIVECLKSIISGTTNPIIKRTNAFFCFLITTPSMKRSYGYTTIQRSTYCNIFTIVANLTDFLRIRKKILILSVQYIQTVSSADYSMRTILVHYLHDLILSNVAL